MYAIRSYYELAALEEKFQTLSTQMSDPAFVADQARYVPAARAYGELQPIVERTRSYHEAEQELAKARDLAANSKRNNFV